MKDDVEPTNRGNGRAKQIQDLRELIDALGRRVPQLGRSGEIQIAQDAADLKQRALKPIAALKR
jgi:hypothetical protein